VLHGVIKRFAALKDCSKPVNTSMKYISNEKTSNARRKKMLNNQLSAEELEDIRELYYIKIF
jgi:hypothetical protein